MKLFALAATLATARQRRAMSVNEQGGTWVAQEAQVSNQVPQVSDQVPQVSNQVPQVSNQVPQVSNQVPQVSYQVPQVSMQVAQVSNQRVQISSQRPQVSDQKPQVSNQTSGQPAAVKTCEESNSNPHDRSGIWFEYGSQEVCNLSELMRQNVNAQFDQFNKKFGNNDQKLSNAWDTLQEEWRVLSTIDLDRKQYTCGAENKDHTGCGILKIKPSPEANHYLSEYSMECGLVCKHIYDINEKDDFKPVLNQLAGVFLISAHSCTYKISRTPLSNS